MKKLISAKLAGSLLLVAFGLLLVFHILVLLRVIPASIIWGGQVSGSGSSLIGLEIFALLITVFFAAIVAAKLKDLKLVRSRKVINAGVWLIVAYLVLNTVGNLASGVSLENFIFAPITLVMALLALRLAVEK